MPLEPSLLVGWQINWDQTHLPDRIAALHTRVCRVRRGFRRHVVLGIVLLYGLYAAATEGISKAWITLRVPKEETATAVGLYASLNSMAALFASSAAGLIWWQAGPGWAFGTTACMALAAFSYLLMTKENTNIA